MVKNIKLGLVFGGLILVLIAVFVMGAGIDSVSLVTPANDSWTTGTNETIAFVFNYTGENASASCELFFNDTAYGLNVSTLNATSTTLYGNATIAEGTDIAWYVNCTNGSTVMSDVWYLNVDRTNPAILTVYPTATNYTTAPTAFNFSYTEANCDKVWYSNDSGATNYSVQACTSNFTSMVAAEDSNTWIVYMNDSAGNENSSSVTFVYDTTDPVASASCSPSSVTSGTSVTCTCSGTDSGSGINSSLTTAGSTVTTSATGTFSYTCSVTDNVGNTDTDSASYVVSSSTSSSGSTTANFWTKGTHIVSDEQFKEGFTRQLLAKQRFQIQVDSEEHHVGVIEMTATTATVNISSDPQQVVLSVGDEEKFEVSGDNYYDILVKLNSIEDDEANVTIQLINEEISEEINVGESDVVGEEDVSVDDGTDEGYMVWIIIGVVIVGVIVTVVIFMKKKGVF